MWKVIASGILSALQQGEFLDKLADLIIVRLKSRIYQLAEVKQSLADKVDAYFDGSGMAGVFMKRLLRDQIDELIASAKAESDGALTVKDLPRILDGIDEEELAAANEIIKGVIQARIQQIIDEKL